MAIFALTLVPTLFGNATARAQGAGAPATGEVRPLKVKMKVFGTSVESGATPLPSVPVSWPSGDPLGEPHLTFSP